MFNTREYEWADINVVMAGRNVTGFRAVSYTSKQEKEALYAKGNKPHSIQRGNKSYEGSISLVQSEYEALKQAAGTTLREQATLSCLAILPTQPSRSLVTPIIYMLLPMVAEPVSDRHSSGAARISRTGP